MEGKRDQIKMGEYMDGRVTPPKRVTLRTWGPPPSLKKALNPNDTACTAYQPCRTGSKLAR